MGEREIDRALRRLLARRRDVRDARRRAAVHRTDRAGDRCESSHDRSGAVRAKHASRFHCMSRTRCCSRSRSCPPIDSRPPRRSVKRSPVRACQVRTGRVKKTRLAPSPRPKLHRCRSHRRRARWPAAARGSRRGIGCGMAAPCASRCTIERRRCRCAWRSRSARQASTEASSTSHPTEAESFRSSPTATASTAS